MTTPQDPDRSAYEETRYADTTAAPGAAPVPPPSRSSGVGFATYLITIIAFVILIVVVVFVTQNTDKITVKFFGTKKYLSIAAALGASAAAGLVAGLLFGFVPQIRLRRKLRQYRRAATR